MLYSSTQAFILPQKYLSAHDMPDTKDQWALCQTSQLGSSPVTEEERLASSVHQIWHHFKPLTFVTLSPVTQLPFPVLPNT